MIGDREFHYSSCISVCFFDEAAGEHVTLENYTYPDHDVMHQEFEDLKTDFHEEFERDDLELLIDLYINDDLHDTFTIRRQMLDRMRAAIAVGRISSCDPKSITEFWAEKRRLVG